MLGNILLTIVYILHVYTHYYVSTEAYESFLHYDKDGFYICYVIHIHVGTVYIRIYIYIYTYIYIDVYKEQTYLSSVHSMNTKCIQSID